ncbi:hypothetical protein Agub_g7080 [Astrephomene gubernaculifera]|uniref:Uncharacterized protein n=1 Tax=Astrephomene gubernaculifera TaxID=47775 RepID=A0AAD3HM04_9CHLO|nr:hypothetical protein Agub_g7080 [Astrephomene gubernaculifera]
MGDYQQTNDKWKFIFGATPSLTPSTSFPREDTGSQANAECQLPTPCSLSGGDGPCFNLGSSAAGGAPNSARGRQNGSRWGGSRPHHPQPHRHPSGATHITTTSSANCSTLALNTDASAAATEAGVHARPTPVGDPAATTATVPMDGTAADGGEPLYNNAPTTTPPYSVAANGRNRDALDALIDLLLLPDDDGGVADSAFAADIFPSDAFPAAAAATDGASPAAAAAVGSSGPAGQAGRAEEPTLAVVAGAQEAGAQEDGGGSSPGCWADLRALAAALDEVEASMLSGEAVETTDAAGTDLIEAFGVACSLGIDGQQQQQQQQGESTHALPSQPRRRPKVVAKKHGSSQAAGTSAAATTATDASAASATSAAAAAVGGSDAGSWRVMLAAPAPHNPEGVATLLLAGRLVNPHTAVPAPLLAAAAAAANQQHQQTQQARQQQQHSSSASGDASASSSSPSEALRNPAASSTDTTTTTAAASNTSYSAASGTAAAATTTTSSNQGPAVALVRCGTAAEAAAALALHGRRVYCPPLTSGGAASWRPLTVLLHSPGSGSLPLEPPPSPAAAAGSSAGASPGSSSLQQQKQARVRDAGPTVRRVILRGLPGHLGGEDLTALFGSGLQLPSEHCPTPQDRRFLLLCPDSVSYNSLLSWHGTRLPDKPLDALQQIVPRVAGWCTLRVEEDDGILLPSLVSTLLAEARRSGAAYADSAAAAAFTTVPHHPPFMPYQQPYHHQQQQYPRVAGRYHPAELDAMDEAAAAAEAAMAAAEATSAATATLASGWSQGGVSRGAVDLPDAATPATTVGGATTTTVHAAPARAGSMRSTGGSSGARGGSGQHTRSQAHAEVEDLAAAAAAERAESSRGASSSGLAARPAPRPRRAGAAAAAAAAAADIGGFYNSSSGLFTPSCACCPPPGFGVGGMGGGGSGFPRPAAAVAAASSLSTAAYSTTTTAALSGGSNQQQQVNSWSGAAAVELLNKLLALGVGPGPGGDGSGGEGVQVEEEERAPFSRRSRKRMPMHFGRRPEDEEGGDEEQDEGDKEETTN